MSISIFRHSSPTSFHVPSPSRVPESPVSLVARLITCHLRPFSCLFQFYLLPLSSNFKPRKTFLKASRSEDSQTHKNTEMNKTNYYFSQQLKTPVHLNNSILLLPVNNNHFVDLWGARYKPKMCWSHILQAGGNRCSLGSALMVHLADAQLLTARATLLMFIEMFSVTVYSLCSLL